MIHLLAASEQLTSETYFDWARRQQWHDGWQFLLAGVVAVAVLAAVIIGYARDSRELASWRRGLLMGLRVAALLALGIHLLGPEYRTRQSLVSPSRAVLLVDTSQSMDRHDDDKSTAAARSRLDEVWAMLQDSPFLATLAEKHEVAVYRFDSSVEKVMQLPRGKKTPGDNTPEDHATDTLKNLSANGAETRLAEAVRDVCRLERGGLLSGIVLFSDGSLNAGADLDLAIQAAKQLQTPVHCVGLGSKNRAANVRIADLAIPSRAYVGADPFTITAYLQTTELAGKEVTVALFSKMANASREEPGQFVQSQKTTLSPEGEATSVYFEVIPEEAGRKTYRVVLTPPAEDRDASDNVIEAEIEILDRQTKVLLFASGPTREYLFVRNMLRRDKTIALDVLLQTAAHQHPISQDAETVLDDFPDTPEKLYPYDCILAFDPDWRALPTNAVRLVEDWVAERAGGLILIAGPVEMDRWVQEENLARIRALYPVEFAHRFAALEDAHYGSNTPWPLALTREGREAEFLSLVDSGAQGPTAWDSFTGVFGFYEAKRAKPGAQVYARYTNPDAAVGSEQPVFMAGQYFGAGRTFYLASGEMWRLRSLGEKYFDRFYTQLVRHVSQGRLLLGTGHAMLLTDQERYLQGGSVSVRVVATDPQFQPLVLPSLTLQMIRPNGNPETESLRPDPARPGSYLAQFPALESGTYHLEVTLPGEPVPVSRRIQVHPPRLEQEHYERNDVLLATLAQRTGGKFYIGTASALGAGDETPLAALLADKTKTTELPPVKDMDFDRKWNQGLLIFLCSALSLEWLLRRLSKLA
jgi:hypothetical protein